jgi:ABC-2 type transport system ATP-binding protein
VGDLLIETKNLRKTYGRVEAVRGLDLRVSAGSICGFLGRNGAGKTTTMKMLLGMTAPSAGTASVFGMDAADHSSSVSIRARTAFVADEKPLYDTMRVGELIRFTAKFFPGWQPDLEATYISRFALPLDGEIGRLSRGMRTKLALLLALCRGAELLMLDEPTSALDPAAAEEVLQAIVSQVARSGTTVFFSSHQLAEIEQIADEIAIIDRGRAIVNGPLDEIREKFRRIQVVFATDAPAHVFVTPGIARATRSGRTLTLIASGDHEPIVTEARGLMPDSIDVGPLTLKDIFLESTRTEEQ